MTEAALWNKVRNGLTEAADLKIDLMRVENMIVAGCPDVNYCFNGIEGWIELKHTDSPPARDGTPVFHNGGLRDEQIVWLYKRKKRGGRCHVLARVGEAIFLVDGSLSREFNTLTYPQLLDQSLWYHIGKKVDWGSLLAAICA